MSRQQKSDRTYHILCSRRKIPVQALLCGAVEKPVSSRDIVTYTGSRTAWLGPAKGSGRVDSRSGCPLLRLHRYCEGLGPHLLSHTIRTLF